jgi:hypothetical protein
MADDPKAFVQEFEQKFAAQQGKPRLELLIHFRPREFHFYILVYLELKVRYRKETHFLAMMETFPVSFWGDTVMELLKGFAKSRPQHPSLTGIENGVSFVEAALRAFPEYFADHLDQLFLAKIRFPGHVGSLMWHQFGAAYEEYLRFHIEENADNVDEQCRALSFLFLIDKPETTRWAKDTLRHHLQVPRKLHEGLNLTREMLNSYLIEQGLIWYGNDLYRLYPEEVWHLIFPQGYLQQDTDHETFQSKRPLPGEYAFGGKMKAQDHRGRTVFLHLLLALDPIPQHLKIVGLHRLYFACNLDQVLLGTGMAYQQHLPNGAITLPKPLQDATEETPIPTEPTTPFVRSARVRFANQGPAWYFQRYIYGHNHYRLGGPPVFFSGTFYPECQKCKRTMRFLMELDSSLPMADGKKLEWGVEGMAYFYWCDDCHMSAIHWRSD